MLFNEHLTFGVHTSVLGIFSQVPQLFIACPILSFFYLTQNLCVTYWHHMHGLYHWAMNFNWGNLQRCRTSVIVPKDQAQWAPSMRVFLSTCPCMDLHICEFVWVLTFLCVFHIDDIIPNLCASVWSVGNLCFLSPWEKLIPSVIHGWKYEAISPPGGSSPLVHWTGGCTPMWGSP